MTGNSGFELHNVSKRYGRQVVLSDISCTLPAGRHTALLGPSGCGKSTLLRLLAGLEPPDSGEVVQGGKLASTPEGMLIAPHKRGVGMVFQDLALWPNLSVLDNVRLGRSVSDARAREALAHCGIEPLAKRRPGELSGGEQQRAALARAIAAHPAFLFLDEPFAGLDWETKSALLEMISALARETGPTILLVSHDPAEVLALARYLIVLETGNIAEEGSIHDAINQPKTSAARHLRTYTLGLGRANPQEADQP
ncbi:ABC transporter ATP-binding protein [Hyphococcus luteus]|uniref:ABC transporter ATP-binding protein n=1 Tax=Hyphococcus luteus TaxID=2058213 RepID=UPI0013FE3668|nr:ATP-binding cassette domain-containing protein [Marinicaulis flavus]